MARVKPWFAMARALEELQRRASTSASFARDSKKRHGLGLRAAQQYIKTFRHLSAMGMTASDLAGIEHAKIRSGLGQLPADKRAALKLLQAWSDQPLRTRAPWTRMEACAKFQDVAGVVFEGRKPRLRVIAAIQRGKGRLAWLDVMVGSPEEAAAFVRGLAWSCHEVVVERGGLTEDGLADLQKALESDSRNAVLVNKEDWTSTWANKVKWTKLLGGEKPPERRSGIVRHTADLMGWRGPAEAQDKESGLTRAACYLALLVRGELAKVT